LKKNQTNIPYSEKIIKKKSERGDQREWNPVRANQSGDQSREKTAGKNTTIKGPTVFTPVWKKRLTPIPSPTLISRAAGEKEKLLGEEEMAASRVTCRPRWDHHSWKLLEVGA